MPLKTGDIMYMRKHCVPDLSLGGEGPGDEANKCDAELLILTIHGD